MYLRRLELQGYKTFAARTEFEFEARITAIVGPNGSGKSNIADALRWVMGEQRYSALRARRSEDMIFAGSQGRTRVGMAEVTLTLDNSSKWLPIEYSEVTLQRRAFRSGENQYYLNGSRVRRRDIVELLAQGGLSSNTYTVIGQGAVDASLSMRPEERRTIFEEAAGISIDQAKRDLSLSKLQDTRNNILRVNDITNELRPRLERLEKQAQRAREYQAKSRELEDLLEVWYAYRWRQAQKQSESAEMELSKHQDALNAQRHRMEETSLQIDELREQQAEVRGLLRRWHEESGLLHGRLEELQRELAVKRERERLLIQRREEIQQDLSPMVASREARLERITELEVELERLNEEREQHEIERADIQTQVAEVQDERRRLEDELAAAREVALGLATGLAEHRNRLAQLEEREAELVREDVEHEEAIDDLNDQMDALAAKIRAAEAERDAVIAKLEQLTAEELEERRAEEASMQRQDELRARRDELRRALSELETRYELLSKLRGELADYPQGPRTVLGHREELSGIVGTVADLLEVPTRLEKAVEAALGNSLQGIVVTTWRDAEAALRLLKEKEAGRATFIPLDSLDMEVPSDVPEGEGVVGRASELVATRTGLERVPRALLGHTLVVDDLDTARSLHQDRCGMHLVTVAGQFMSRHGFIRGGFAGPGSGLLGRERERRQLPEQIRALRVDVEGLEQELVEEKALQQSLADKLGAIKQEKGSLERTLKAQDEQAGSWRLKEGKVSQEIEWRRVVQTGIRDEIAKLREKERVTAQEVEAAESQQQDAVESIEALQVQLASLDPSALQERLAALRTAIAVLERSRETHKSALEGHRSSLEEIGSQLTAKESRVEELAAEGRALESSVATLTAKIEELSGRAEDLSGLIGPAERKVSELEREQVRLEKDEREGRQNVVDYEATYSKWLLRRQRRQDDLESLRERIEAEMEMVTLSTEWPSQSRLDIDARLRSLPVVTELPDGLGEKIKRLRERLRKVGPVDLDAVAEHQEVLERYSFLTSQIEDLEKASQSLRKVVLELDRLMQEKFLETFTKVAAEFEIYFTRLFNGGSGQLQLTDPDNPLESGVEILTQPPGRRRASVTALSGGERALTGVALTFAILSVCATPFCLLDEVDARLDEVNIDRFRQAVKELAERTQVILITHNRGTVEISDAIYGITMGRDSSSRVLSLRLEEVEAKAS